MLGVGVATLDIVLEVAAFPQEDQEVRALARSRRRGGNAANSLGLLAQLGHAATWMGVIGDDPDAQFVVEALTQDGVAHDRAVRVPGAGVPTSYVCLSQARGSRTILHYRDLPELTAAEFARVPLAGFDWVHFEGRNPQETAAMLLRARQERPQATLSLELEKPRPGLEALLGEVDVLLIGRGFAEAQGGVDPEAFLRGLLPRSGSKRAFLAWGAEGGYALGPEGVICRCPSFPPARVVDTLGAGDVFNAGVIHALLSGCDEPAALEFACCLAGYKCGQRGFEGLGDEAALWRCGTVALSAALEAARVGPVTGPSPFPWRPSAPPARAPSPAPGRRRGGKKSW